MQNSAGKACELASSSDSADIDNDKNITSGLFTETAQIGIRCVEAWR